MTARASALLLALLAAGCASPDAPADPGPGAGVPATDGLLLTGCAGLQAFSNQPAAAASGNPPPGWDPAPADAVLTGVSVLALRCQRIGTGPFERGPHHLLLEWHTNADPPAACMASLGGANSDVGVLANVLVDDAALAAHLRDAHGMPAAEAAFDVGVLAPGAAGVHDWQWRALDGPTSRLAVAGDSPQQPEPAEVRLFWGLPQGIGILDLAMARSGSVADRPAVGHFEEPMLLAQAADGGFAGVGEWFSTLDAPGKFTRHGDSQCREGPA